MITTIKGTKGKTVRAKIVVTRKLSSRHWINRLIRFVKKIFKKNN